MTLTPPELTAALTEERQHKPDRGLIVIVDALMAQVPAVRDAVLVSFIDADVHVVDDLDDSELMALNTQRDMGIAGGRNVVLIQTNGASARRLRPWS